MISDNLARRLQIALADNNAGAEAVATLNNIPAAASATEVVTALNTVGAGTITAAGIAGHVTTRGGAQAGAAFTDTTGTAAAIIAALPNAQLNQSWEWSYKNNTNATATLTGGTGVTVSVITVVPANCWARFLVTYSAAATVTVVGIASGSNLSLPPEASTALTTVGAGTITAAGVVGRITLRTGPTSAFTDTTDTGTNIAAAVPNIQIGEAFEWTYQNQSAYLATLTGGVGVNAAATFGIVGAGCWATYLFTYTAANTFSVSAVAAGANFGGLPPFSYSTGTTTGTFTAGEMTGGQLTVYKSTATTPGSIATATAAAMLAALPAGTGVGTSWVLRIINGSSAANTMTITADASVTLSGTTTYTIAEFAYRDFLITLTSATTATMVAIGGGAAAVN